MAFRVYFITVALLSRQPDVARLIHSNKLKSPFQFYPDQNFKIITFLFNHIQPGVRQKLNFGKVFLKRELAHKLKFKTT